MLSSPLKIAEWLVFKSTSTSIVSTVPVPDLLVRRDKDSLGARSGSRTATGPGGDAGEEHRRKDAARPRVRGRTVQARTIPWAKGEEKRKGAVPDGLWSRGRDWWEQGIRKDK
jgi:hypothetical protein